jgi:GxxExxY protein
MNPPSESIFPLCDNVRAAAFALHRFLRHGHLEKVYEHGLAHRLHKAGIAVTAQHSLAVMDEDGTLLGSYYADLFVQECLLVEIKACRSLLDEHVAQLLGYFRSSRIEHGMLINFGSPKLQVRKFILSDVG